MSSGIANIALFAAVVAFAVGEVVVLGQILRDARRDHLSIGNWLTQAAWAIVPLLMLTALLVAASRSEHSMAPSGSVFASEGKPR